MGEKLVLLLIILAQICTAVNVSDPARPDHSIQETFNISHEAIWFLKGFMITRIMPSFNILVVLVGLPLNTLTFVMFSCWIRAKEPSVIYMSHLACVDLIFTLLLPLKIHYRFNSSDWVFGEVACRVITAAYNCYMYCSILLMMSMSVDRLLAVALPIASKTWRNPRNATYMCGLVWALALSSTMPFLLIRQTFKVNEVGITCHDVLSYNDPTVQNYVNLFSILSCFYFFLPLIVTSTSYFIVIYVLSGTSDCSATSSSSNRRRRAVIMTVAMLMEFLMCFALTNGILLYHCILLAVGNNGDGDSSYTAYLLSVILGSSSVFLDPLLYYNGSPQCRKLIRSVFCGRKAKPAKTTSSMKTYKKCQLTNHAVFIEVNA